MEEIDLVYRATGHPAQGRTLLRWWCPAGPWQSMLLLLLPLTTLLTTCTLSSTS